MSYKDEVVKAENLTKIYKLYNKPINRLKEIIFKKPFHMQIIALKGITFNLKRGETLGIIGENGAGKSTLLKILSKTLTPTNGYFEMNGLVSSLLELGSGFHPEFTGIDNIFFYGALIGLDKEFMKKKIEEIIDFSELKDFINYPIKTYSTGMYLRLAFSVATSVDPDILIIDEALSVGDQCFQKKCLDKMDSFKKRNKTIIFCSHDTYQIRMFCEKTMWLHNGKIKMFGKSDDVINAYTNHSREKSEKYKTNTEIINPEASQKDTFIFINDLTATQKDNKSILIEFNVSTLEPFEGHIGWSILRRDMLQISFITTYMQGLKPIKFEGSHKVKIIVDNLNIVNDNYFIYVGIFDKMAYKPIAVESIDHPIHTGYEIHNSLSFFDSKFIVE